MPYGDLLAQRVQRYAALSDLEKYNLDILPFPDYIARGPGFPRNFIPSFSWGGATGFSTYHTSKAFEAAEVMMERRGKKFNDQEAAILEHVFELTKKWRKY